MAKKEETGAVELRRALAGSRSLFMSVALFSVFVNILVLTGPMFMLQVYDRVLASRSEPTLFTLLGLVTALFLLMGILDLARTRVLSRAGARFQEMLDGRVFDASLRRALSPEERGKPNTALRDLESIQRVLSGPAPFAFFDSPWAPIFLAAIFLFHWAMGVFAVCAGLLLFTLAYINQRNAKEPILNAASASARAENYSETLRREGETLKALGMRGAALSRWQGLRRETLGAQIASSDATSTFSVTSKNLRMFLQSGILALGAWLAIKGEISPGMMIAGSILMGRALAPVEQAIGQWAGVERAIKGWRTLSEMLQKTPPEAERTQLPQPKGLLEAQGLVAGPPGMPPTLKNVSLRVEPGQALGVIGPSASGKSTLARILTGIWRPLQGSVRLDGAALDQYRDDDLGASLGYLPQDVALFDGTVAENISRLRPDADDAKIVEAAKRAGAHEIILKLPMGYDTPLGPSGARVSGGQRQRIALARALYDDPAVVILDEPNSNLDAVGEQALVAAIKDLRERGKSVIVMAHRPSAIQACDILLMLDQGVVRAFGPKEQVLRETTANHPQLLGQKPAAAIPAQPQESRA